MISAVDQAQANQRRKTKSAASGPAFSVPGLTGAADISPVTAPNVSAASCYAPASTSTPTSSLDLTGFLGKSVGSGQCVALVRAAAPTLGSTANWTPGAAVENNPSIAPGTPIATFDPSNRYANATDGSSHAAIYLGQDQHGLQVLDQWSGSAASVRTIPWSTPGATAANSGAAFRVIKSA